MIVVFGRKSVEINSMFVIYRIDFGHRYISGDVADYLGEKNCDMLFVMTGCYGRCLELLRTYDNTVVYLILPIYLDLFSYAVMMGSRHRYINFPVISGGVLAVPVGLGGALI